MHSIKSITKAIPFAISLAAAALSFSGASFAEEKVIPPHELAKFQDEAKDIRTQALPMGRVMVTNKNGVTAIMSDNGRFRFEGSIVDTWAQIEISSYEDAVFSAEHLPLERIGLESSMLAPMEYGENEDQKVLVFLSPDDPASREFLSQLPAMKGDFSFELVVVPSSTTPTSMAAAFSCVSDEGDAFEKLLSGKELLSLVPTKDCDFQMLNNRMIAFNLLGFYDLPTVIAPSSRVGVSTVDGGWKKFLMENLK